MENNFPSSRAYLINIIGNATMFAGIGLEEQEMLAARCSIIQCDKDQVIIDQGEIGDTLYIIIQGQIIVSVKQESTGLWNKVNTLFAGDVFGEIAIIRNIPRTARITTETACTFLTINSKNFLDAYQYFPPRARDNIQLIIEKRLAGLQNYKYTTDKLF